MLVKYLRIQPLVVKEENSQITALWPKKTHEVYCGWSKIENDLVLKEKKIPIKKLFHLGMLI